MECDIYDCPRNESGKCELSKMYEKGHEYYTEPKICTHHKFKKREK